MDFDNGKEQVTRRQMIRVLAAFGITGPAALELAAKAQDRLSPEALEAATALLDQDFDEERIEVVAAALRNSLGQFQIVRDLEIDDRVEPAPIFLARGRP